MNKKGFTLVETVVSLAILGIMAIMTAGIFSSASLKTAENLNSMKQKELLLGQIETVISNGIDSIPSELAQSGGDISIDFEGSKINAKGIFLTGVYGDNKLITKYFYVTKTE